MLFYHRRFALSINSSFIAFAIALASNGGTALPIWTKAAVLGPSKKKLSGNDCIRAASRTEMDLVLPKYRTVIFVESLIMSNPEMDAFQPVPPNQIWESPDICVLIHASILFIVLCTIQLGTLEIHILRLAVIISIKSTAECCNILDTAEIGFQERTKRRHGIVRQFNAEYISARYQRHDRRS